MCLQKQLQCLYPFSKGSAGTKLGLATDKTNVDKANVNINNYWIYMASIWVISELFFQVFPYI